MRKGGCYVECGKSVAGKMGKIDVNSIFPHSAFYPSFRTFFPHLYSAFYPLSIFRIPHFTLTR